MVASFEPGEDWFFDYEKQRMIKSVELLPPHSHPVSAMQALTSFLYLAPLLILQGGSSASAFTPEQLQALALLFLKLNQYAFNIDLVFFGIWCVLTGYLIFRSTFLPRIFGVLLAISGLGYVTYLYPPLAYHLFVPYIASASALGEIPLELWLIVMGVNVQRWKEQASAAGEW